MRGESILYFWFLKIVHLHLPNQKNHHCGSQRNRSVLLIGLCWPSKAGGLQKWKTWINPYFHRPFMRWRDYFLFIVTLDACLAVWYYHIDINWHLGNTWLLFLFTKLENWTSSSDGLTILPLVSSLIFSIADWFCCLAGLMLASPVYLKWAGLYLIILLESRSQFFQKSTMLSSFHVW